MLVTQRPFDIRKSLVHLHEGILLYVQYIQYICRLRKYVKEHYFYLKINRFSVAYMFSFFIQHSYNLISIESSALGPAIITLLLAVIFVCNR